MLAKERLAYIIRRLEADSALSVTTLSKELNISLSTVQRDLRKLEKEGKIERERGGAVSNEFAQTLTTMSEVSVENKVSVNPQAKDCIAKRAQEVILDGECIFVDSGTTTGHLAPYLMNRNITIITNSHYLIQKMRGCKAKVIILGGEYDSKYDMSKGAMTLQEIKQYHYDRCFISGSGVNIENGEVYSVEDDNGILKSNIMERSNYKYLLADHSKYEIRALYTFAMLDDFHEVFVDTHSKMGRKRKNIVVCKEDK